jgi:hypothetical protein
MEFHNWTLSISAPITEYMRDSQLVEADSAKGITAQVKRAAHAAGESPDAFYEWLANIGCAATNIVFFDGPVPSHPTRVNLILIAENAELTPTIRDERLRAPKSVNYFYTAPEWLKEMQFENSVVQFPGWVLGALSASHAALSAPGNETGFGFMLFRARERVMGNPDGHLADLVAADIYAAITAKLPKERSLMTDLPDFKKECSKFGLSNDKMTDMALRAMERRRVKPDRMKPLMKALEAYRG